jgi:hypothetical protein
VQPCPHTKRLVAGGGQSRFRRTHYAATTTSGFRCVASSRRGLAALGLYARHRSGLVTLWLAGRIARAGALVGLHHCIGGRKSRERECECGKSLCDIYRRFYYLFRATSWGYPRGTYVYRSETPYNFGVNDDSKLICTFHNILAPEIVQENDQYYINSLGHFQGIQMVRLRWELDK